ncbi:TIGR00645 family protein [Leucobacter sp. W1153]|uniref:TIGR00645 family protein n=1 Tax=Leucobacter sp. W1153 TaxID=3439064 RepID=UPI003F40EB51
MSEFRTSSVSDTAIAGPGLASRTLAGFIFASRWLQAPLYLGLIIAQAIYVVLFFVELWHLIETAIINGHFTETEVMLSVLALIDIVMIANLLIMVIIGGYETFVSKIRVAGHHDEPDWLSHVNANLLKVKLAVSIISISSIHLLKTFIEVGRMDGGIVTAADGRVIYSSEGVMWEVAIHLAFIVSALALAWIDKMGHASPRVVRRTSAPRMDPQPSTALPVSSEAPATSATGAGNRESATVGQQFVTVRLPIGAKLPEGAEIVDR